MKIRFHLFSGIIVLAAMQISCPLFSQQTIPLYADSIPNAVSGGDEEYTGQSGELMKVSRPTLTIYLPTNVAGKRKAVVICPGGGYGSLVIDREGHDAARALSKKGFAVFVLKYRLPDDRTMRIRSVGPLQDAQRAIQWVREHAQTYHLDSAAIGIMGFSAGGHLASESGVASKEFISNPRQTKLRPDFMVLVYPVITMDTVVGHSGSTYNLLGQTPSAADIAAHSTNLHVDKDTPPAFITVAGDDHLMSSSLLFFQAMHEKSVPAELHIYSTGGHGYLKYPGFREWSDRFINWMEVTFPRQK